MPTLQPCKLLMDGFFQMRQREIFRHKCLNFDTCHRFEQKLAPDRESKVRSSTIWPPAAKLPIVLDARNMVQ
jgi:hypothetical protein